MDTILMVVTALSLATATTMTVVVITLLRQERARAEARVAVLSAMSADPVSSRREASPLPIRRTVGPTLAQPPRTDRVPLADFDLRPADHAVAGVSQLFMQAESRSPWGRRAAVAGALAAVLLVIGFAAASASRSRAVVTHEASAPESSMPAQGSAPGAVPLELLSLHHVQEAERLVITGVVQNPRRGAALSRLMATAFLLGPDGTFLTSQRAPIDFTNLTPGMESPFVVTVPVTGTVARYRVGFRTEDGRVIAHVDRRTPEALAQK
jgi:hypothetical protein